MATKPPPTALHTGKRSVGTKGLARSYYCRVAQNDRRPWVHTVRQYKFVSFDFCIESVRKNYRLHT